MDQVGQATARLQVDEVGLATAKEEVQTSSINRQAGRPQEVMDPGLLDQMEKVNSELKKGLIWKCDYNILSFR